MKHFVLVFIFFLLPFSSAIAEYSEEVALEAIVYSFATYCHDADSLQSWSCEECAKFPHMRVLEIFDSAPTGAHGFVGIDKINRKIVVAFRGTCWSDIETVFTDLKCYLSDFPQAGIDSAVHSGFLDYYVSVRKSVRAQLTSLLDSNPDFEVWITGHSLGAAVAQIAAVDLYNIVPDPIVYLFGSPRVGNFPFSQHYNSVISRSFRIVHSNDIISQLPPCLYNPFTLECMQSELSLYHTAQEIFYDKGMAKGAYKNCHPDDGEDDCVEGPFFAFSVLQHKRYFGMESFD